jgi:hypothetical protein
MHVIHSNYKKGMGKYPCLYNILMSLEVANTFFWTQMKKLAPKKEEFKQNEVLLLQQCLIAPYQKFRLSILY